MQKLKPTDPTYTTEPRADSFVGVLDSGVGGISVLRALIDELPHEDFHYFGDSAHAPYGEKSEAEVLALSRGIVEDFLAQGAKAIVIACNTATSVAATTLRSAFPEVPIVGVEPALKPATEAADHGCILVMATEVTLRLDKYHELARTYGQGCEIISVPCPGLAARIEQGNLEATDLRAMIEAYVGAYAGSVGSVVLGCTHYPFVRAQIEAVLGQGIRFYDGRAGTARQLRKRLQAAGLLRDQSQPGAVELASSANTSEELALYQQFLELPL